MKIEKLSVIGLGKLGACLAAVLADRGFEVTGVDKDESKVESINNGLPPVHEPGLGRMIQRGRRRLRAVGSIDEAVKETDATFIVVPTPSTESGAFSLEYVSRVSTQIGRSLRPNNHYHLVIVTSTVLPGAMTAVIRPMLEKHSHKNCGNDFGLCYNPEFIALGNVIEGLLEPDFILIGESDSRAGKLLSGIHKRVCSNSPPIARMNFVSAEIAKFALNSYVTMKISFANTLAELCEKFAGADIDVVTSAIGLDKRIGKAYMRGGLGYGGPCFPRDNLAFAYVAKKVHAQSALARATHQVNIGQVNRILRLVKQTTRKRRNRVGILGLAYKPDTNVVEASQSTLLAQSLARAGYKVRVYDPVADLTSSFAMLEVTRENSAKAVISNSDVCIIATPWNEFKLEPESFRGKVVIDCWRILDRDKIGRIGKYFGIGIGNPT